MTDRISLPVTEKIQYAGWPKLRLEYLLVFEPDGDMTVLVDVEPTAMFIDRGNGFGIVSLTADLRDTIIADVMHRAAGPGGHAKLPFLRTILQHIDVDREPADAH